MTGPVQTAEVAPVSGRTDNPLLKEIEQRAIKSIHQKRRDLPSSSSVSISQNIWANELVLEIAGQMVQDVREDVAAHYNGCSVCYMIAGEPGTTHRSGRKCLKMPLTTTTVGWPDFKERLKFIEGILCWDCLLPTVCTLSNNIWTVFNIRRIRTKDQTWPVLRTTARTSAPCGTSSALFSSRFTSTAWKISRGSSKKTLAIAHGTRVLNHTSIG